MPADAIDSAGPGADFGADLAAALDASGDLVYTWDVEGDSIRWTGPVTQAFALDDAHAVATGDRFHARINSEDLKQRLKLLSRHFAGNDRFDCEYRVRTGAGGFCWVHERGRIERGPGGRPRRMHGILRCITGRKRSEERLEYLANFDELTGVYNRSRLRQSVDHALTSCARHSRSGGYLVVDIDNIAMVNDAYGLTIGDEVVTGLAERLAALVGASDLIGRVDADAFGILLDQGDEDYTGTIAERIVRAVRDGPIATSIGDVAVTVSVGGIVFPESAKTAHDVMARAEVALHRVKRSGRNRFGLYRLSEVERVNLRRDMGIAREVHEALADNRLLFAYQPIVESASAEPAFYECLLRMRRANGEILAAGHFVPVVEQLGLIRQIDRCALELAVQELAADPGVRLAINISGLTATDHSWLRSLVTLLRGKPELASRLIVEITETAALQDIEESVRFVTGVRDLGCRVALDDFGAGYSSFRHLKALPVDMVKIDGSFVGQIGEHIDNLLFIRTLLGLAHGFNLETVAECVESADEAEILRREGVTYLQGRHFGAPQLERPDAPRPADLEDIARRLALPGMLGGGKSRA